VEEVQAAAKPAARRPHEAAEQRIQPAAVAPEQQQKQQQQQGPPPPLQQHLKPPLAQQPQQRQQEQAAGGVPLQGAAAKQEKEEAELLAHSRWVASSPQQPQQPQQQQHLPPPQQQLQQQAPQPAQQEQEQLPDENSQPELASTSVLITGSCVPQEPLSTPPRTRGPQQQQQAGGEGVEQQSPSEWSPLLPGVTPQREPGTPLGAAATALPAAQIIITPRRLTSLEPAEEAQLCLREHPHGEAACRAGSRSWSPASGACSAVFIAC